MKRHPIGTMVGGAILAAWIPFWTFLSGLSTIDFMRTSGGHPSIGTFYLPASLSAGFSVVGIGVMVYAFILLYRHTSADTGGSIAVPVATTGVTPGVSVPKSSDNPISLAAMTLPDALLGTVTLPDGRAVSSCSLEDLIAVHKANTTAGTHKLLVGKWTKFSGIIHDIKSDGYLSMTSVDPSNMLPVFVLKFAEGWEEQLSALQRGSYVTVRGQIVGLDYNYVRLERCELL